MIEFLDPKGRSCHHGCGDVSALLGYFLSPLRLTDRDCEVLHRNSGLCPMPMVLTRRHVRQVSRTNLKALFACLLNPSRATDHVEQLLSVVKMPERSASMNERHYGHPYACKPLLVQ